MFRIGRFSALFGVFLGASLAFTADAPPVPRTELNERVVQGLNAALDVGVPIFNKGDHQGCYEIYQGALLAVKPLLAGSPELAQRVQSRLDRAQTLTKAADRAFELRNAIDDIRREFRKPLWDRLGGEKAVSDVVHEFAKAALADPKVNFTRNNQYRIDGPALERKLVELISAVTGGPLKYTGKDMKTAHAGMRISEEEFNALAADLVATLKTAKVPQPEIDELVGIVASTKKDIVEGGAVVVKKSLWDRLGGEDAVKTVVHDFVLAAAADAKVNFTRNGQFKLDAEGITKLERGLVEFVSAASGGPLKYTGRDMKTVHTGMKITEDEFNALAVDLAVSLKKFNVPQAEIDELMGAIATTRKDILGQ